VLEAEKAKAEQDAANKAEAKKLQEDMEGDPEEEEEDLTPGTPVTPVASTSKKRPAQDDAETPKRPAKVTRISPRRSMFTKVVKHNIKDKKQLQFDLRFARYMVGTNLSMAHAANIETLEFFEEFLPIYHIKNPSTFTRYYSGLFALLQIQHNITAHICITTITTSNFCNFRISQVFHIFLETKCHFCTPIARQLLTRSWLSNCHNAKVCPSQQTTGPPGVVTLTWG
jgi:hypothetical protein